ncbi:threonine-phosphate decarboxylase CobD [Bacillus benzoevorans]|uniref:threonine-phosphate decarboxylase n=1 Tax=Bacillus benzoevorans TaxID=1456 RepID=A0A7X0HXB5_9BACI|nr:threonine-phosphate decarboxylase CobD [Bacillus benzoevorans]MBB6447692.1 threonine-phosphate decarboxylase [Bacillus benzoevorans]
MKWPSHGSNPHYLYEAAGLKQPERILDFSANINPLGPPDSLKNHWSEFFQGISQYPDPHAASLKARIAEREGVEEEQILIGNGGAELISLLGRMLTGKQVVIVEPAFSEYEQACRVNNCQIEYFALDDSGELNFPRLLERLSHTDAVFLCNPNNPTGVYFSRNIVIELLQECKKQNCLLIVDEAFYDFVVEYETLVPLLKESEQLLILRSLTKMFAIPGLRLGFAMSSKERIESLAAYQSHWSVNGVALAAGTLCLEEDDYIKRTQGLIALERERLFSFYKKNRFAYSPSRVNFYLLQDMELGDQYPLFAYLLQKGIVPRHTFNFPGLEAKWLRFAVRGRVENDTLMGALAEWRSNHRSSL